MSEAQSTTVAELLQTIDLGWNQLYGFIDTLSEPQLTELTDAAGWTAKDHLMHVASWEDTLNALLEQTPRWERMGIDQALWRSEDIDQISALLQKRYQALLLTVRFSNIVSMMNSAVVANSCRKAVQVCQPAYEFRAAGLSTVRQGESGTASKENIRRSHGNDVCESHR